MIKQYRRLSGSWKYPYYIPVSLLPKEFVEKDKVVTVVHEESHAPIEIYPDQFMPIAAYKNMENINYKIRSSFANAQNSKQCYYP